MVLKDGRKEIPREDKTQLSCTKDWGVNVTKIWGRLLPTSKQVLETRGSSTSAKGVPGSCLCLALLAVFPGISRVPVGSTCGYHWSTATSDSGMFWASREEKWGSHMIQTLAMPNGFGGLRRATMDQDGIPPSALQKAAWVFQMVGGYTSMEWVCILVP